MTVMVVASTMDTKGEDMALVAVHLRGSCTAPPIERVPCAGVTAEDFVQICRDSRRYQLPDASFPSLILSGICAWPLH
jgi:hypothetical protein